MVEVASGTLTCSGMWKARCYTAGYKCNEEIVKMLPGDWFFIPFSDVSNPVL